MRTSALMPSGSSGDGVWHPQPEGRDGQGAGPWELQGARCLGVWLTGKDPLTVTHSSSGLVLTWYLPCEGHHPTSLCGSQHFSLPATQAESQPTPRVTPAFGECRRQTPEAFLCGKLCQGSRVTPR